MICSFPKHCKNPVLSFELEFFPFIYSVTFILWVKKPTSKLCCGRRSDCFSVCPCKAAPLCCCWTSCGSYWHCWAVTSHPLPSGACPPPPPPYFTLEHPLFHSPCVLSVVFGNGVIIGQLVSHFNNELSVCSLSVSLSLAVLSPISISSSASDLPMAVLCTLSLTDFTHNA